jgi:hypothetical protein
MTTDDLIAALDSHGGDLARWPEDLRALARAAEADDPAFRAALAEQRALDAIIHKVTASPALPFGYATRLAARARESAESRRLFRIPRWMQALGAGWATASVVAGVVYANVLASSDPDVLALAEFALGSFNLVAGN